MLGGIIHEHLHLAQVQVLHEFSRIERNEEIKNNVKQFIMSCWVSGGIFVRPEGTRNPRPQPNLRLIHEFHELKEWIEKTNMKQFGFSFLICGEINQEFSRMETNNTI